MRLLDKLKGRSTAPEAKESIYVALTRESLRAMGLTDEQVDSIIEMHTDTVDGLKADVSKYKSDAEKLSTV